MPSRHTDALGALRSFLDDLENAITLARTLVEDGQQVDLTGFDRQVGLLCAKVLDLPPEQGRLVRSDLAVLLAGVDALTGCLMADRP
ncbi:MAG: hypothetical protein AB7F35_22610 [Acetobacteraceae bacterium]